MATHSSILAWATPWTEEPGGLQSMGSQRIRHDFVIKQQSICVYIHTYIYIDIHKKYISIRNILWLFIILNKLSVIRKKMFFILPSLIAPLILLSLYSSEFQIFFSQKVSLTFLARQVY